MSATRPRSVNSVLTYSFSRAMFCSRDQFVRKRDVIWDGELAVFALFLPLDGVPEGFPIVRPIRGIFRNGHGVIEDVALATEVVLLAVSVVAEAFAGCVCGGPNDLLAVRPADNRVSA